ncbi:MAG: flagellar basal body rod C-terminal domain-containing protein [Huintestinicola sp.]
MASSFFGLYVQRDALQLAQKGLDITGHNISNIDTAGYSRQRLDICSVANTKGSLGYNTSVSLAGKGADAIGVTQIRDKLLDAKVRKYNAELCDRGAKTTVLADIEDVLDDVENADTGLAAILGNLKENFQNFSVTGTDRNDLANICVSSAQSVINVLQNFDVRINDISTSVKSDVENTDKRINAILKEMASLNKQIEDAYVQMNDVMATRNNYVADVMYGPLELKDDFNNLADELSQYLNITVTEDPEGAFTVEFGDKTLVHKDQYAKTDVKFVLNAKDSVTDTKSDPPQAVKAYFQKTSTFYDDKGKVITSNPPAAGTPLFDENGKLLDLVSDGMGGFTDTAGNAVKVYFTDEQKFYYSDPTVVSSEPAKEVQDWMSLKDGSNIYDEDGFEIQVEGFTEFYVSNMNTEKQWIKTERPATTTLTGADKDTYNNMVAELNRLVENCDVERAFRYEREIMDKFPADYDPIFKEHLIEQGKDVPSYAISIDEKTDTLESGTIEGLFDMYNGKGEAYADANENDYKGVKYYSETLRSLARTIVEGFNSIYADVNKTYETTAGYEPFKMFEYNGTDEIANLKVADIWRDKPIRCVHPEMTKEADGSYKDILDYQELSNDWVNKILNQFESKHDFGKEPSEYTYEEFVAFYGNTLGSQLEYELGNFDSTTTMLTSVSSAREEVMGVSMDEEGVNMMNYQKWYNAISRMITSLDQCLEKLINGTGVCGL